MAKEIPKTFCSKESPGNLTLDPQVLFPEFLVQWVSMYLYLFPDYFRQSLDREPLVPIANLCNFGSKEIFMNYRITYAGSAEFGM